jgi:peptide/nickel transport system permease protein
MVFRSVLSKIALSLLLLFFSISFFAYFIIPDKTQHANLQVVEIAFREPGYRCYFFKIPIEKPEKVSFLRRLWKGEKPTYTVQPFERYSLHGDSLYLFYSSIHHPSKKNHVVIYLPEFFEKSKSLGWINQNQPYEPTWVVSHFTERKVFWLGTDKLGRDYLSRLIVGGRISLMAGLVGMLVSLLIGTLIGLLAGYWRGWLDRFLVWFFSVVWSLPTILLVMAISFALGKGFLQVLIAIGLTLWVDVARTVRGQVMSIRERLHITAAKALGIPSWRIILFHVFPEVRSILFILAASNFSTAMLVESGVSFLGLGIQPPVPSWGNMIRDYYTHLVLPTAYLAILPGILLAIVIFSLMVMANELRDYYDVRNA